MIVSLKAVHCITLAALCITLAGCEVPSFSSKPETRLVSVPSSKPYRYIKYSPQCEIDTLKRIKLHNETHWKVKEAERAAAEQK